MATILTPASTAFFTDALLTPISAERPAGVDITIEPEWQEIREARRSDDPGNQGKWEVDRKTANWHAVQDLTVSALSNKSKDLRLACWLTEAGVNLHGFSGLRDGLYLIRGLLEQYWDLGLFPPVEDGEIQYRARPLEFLGGDKLPTSIRMIAATARTDSDRDYSCLDYQESRKVGFEKDLYQANGDIDEDKRQRRLAALASGRISGEMFDAAVKATAAPSVERLSSDFEAAALEFKLLEKTIDEKFGNEAPGFAETRQALADWAQLNDTLVRLKRADQPAIAISDSVPSPSAGEGSFAVSSLPNFSPSFAGRAWDQAEALIRQGQVRQGLAEMAALAALEHGRVRFQRKLSLAEVCLATNRNRLGVAILEELAKQLEELRLDQWESPELIGRVWGLLYKCYRSSPPDSELGARGTLLFDKLARLDPWQAIRWETE